MQNERMVMMNRVVVTVMLSLFIVIASLWFITFHYGLVPAHARDPLGSQNTPLE